MKKVISFSLWGTQPKYLVGAVRNAELCPQIYPDWIARYYIGTSVPVEIRQRLRSLGAEVIEMNEPGDRRGMFWRFAAASDPEVAVMLSRDCDSRLTEREAAAVTQWLNSSAEFHILRDHPFHAKVILGGMWGVKAPLLREMSDLIEQYPKGDFWQVDQNFLRDIIYPKVKAVALVHDEFFGGMSFPTQRRKLEFIGQVIDEHGRTSRGDQRALAQAIIAKPLRMVLRRTRQLV